MSEFRIGYVSSIDYENGLCVDNNVGQRNFKCVYTVDAEKAANGALHRYRRVKVDKVLGILRNAVGRFAGFINKISIEVKF